MRRSSLAGALSGVAHPAASMRKAFRILHPERGYSPHVKVGTSGPTISLSTAVEETVAIKAFAEMLKRKIDENSPNGTIDYNAVAAACMAEMMRNQR